MEKFKGKYRISSARLKNWNYGSPGFYFVTICTRNRKHFFGDIIEKNNIAFLNPTNIGIIANEYWEEIPIHFPFVELDEYVIMPNHIHGILSIVDISNDFSNVETLHATSLQHQQPNHQQPNHQQPNHQQPNHQQPNQQKPNHQQPNQQQPNQQQPNQQQPNQNSKSNSVLYNFMSEISPKTGSLSTVLRSYKSAVTNWCNVNEKEFGWQPRFHDHIIRSEAELNRIRNYIINNPKNWYKDKHNNENLLM